MPVDRNRMSELHEKFAADLFGGEKSRASGATWKNQGDGENNRMSTRFPFTWDAKSTRGKGITVDRAMIDKITEQAGGQDPAILLRFYDTDDLREIGHDWVAVPAAAFGELLAAARLMAKTTEAVADTVRTLPDPGSMAVPPPVETGAAFFPVIPPPPAALHGSFPPDLPPPPHELWPCLVIDARHDGPELVRRGYFVSDGGVVSQYDIETVRAEPVSASESRLVVNDVLIHRGQLYIDGSLELQVGGPRR
jgi:hypothetical protein